MESGDAQGSLAGPPVAFRAGVGGRDPASYRSACRRSGAGRHDAPGGRSAGPPGVRLARSRLRGDALGLAVSLAVIYIAAKFSHTVFDNPGLKNKVIEPEIKYLFLLLLLFMYFAQLGNGEAVLPAFVLGLLMSKHFKETSVTKDVRNKLRTVAYAIITPAFFVVGGMNVSIPLIATGVGLFFILFFIKFITKGIGVYFFAKKYIPEGPVYTTLLMSTGLTFGTIASVFGLTSGIIDQGQFSILIGVVIMSAVIPTFIAQKWFKPVHEEDIVEINDENGTIKKEAVLLDNRTPQTPEHEMVTKK